MLKRVVKNCDAVPARVTADSGYFSAANVAFAEALGAEPFISVGAHRNDGEPDELRLAKNLRSAEREAMRQTLATDEGRAVYARRKATVEPVFGQTRNCRGIQKLSFRGIWKNRCEWLLICT